MSDTDKFISYRPSAPPKIKGGEANFLQKELLKLRQSLESVYAVLKALEARLDAGSL